MSIDSFYKVLGYACFYKSDVQFVNTIKADEITISYISKHYPRKLIQHLKTVRQYCVLEVEKGICPKENLLNKSQKNWKIMWRIF